MSAGSQSNRRLIGDVLRQAREESKLTQAEVAGRLSRPQKWVSLIERGIAHCRFDDFVAIATALGADPMDLCARYLDLKAPLGPGVATRRELASKRWRSL